MKFNKKKRVHPHCGMHNNINARRRVASTNSIYCKRKASIIIKKNNSQETIVPDRPTAGKPLRIKVIKRYNQDRPTPGSKKR